MLLAAYRRDDWSAADQAILGGHLTACPACRALEAQYRQVGEQVRQLPSVPPPAAFRASVYAAIRADQARLAGTSASRAQAETDPVLPAILPLRPTARTARRAAFARRPLVLAAAAMILLSLFTASLLPALGVDAPARLAASLSAAFGGSTATPTGVATYTLDARATSISGVLASRQWLAVAATDATGHSLLLLENRATRQTRTLTTAADPLTLRALGERWVVWTAGGSLYAAALSTGGSGSPSALLPAEAPLDVTGAWASGDRLLLTTRDAQGTSMLRALDLATGRSTLLASNSTHLLASPSADGATTYWAETWTDASGQTHSIAWQAREGAAPVQAVPGDQAYLPHATAGTLLWLQGTGQSQSAGAITGTLEARTLSSGQQWTVGSATAARAMYTAGPVVVWRDGTQVYSYDLRSRAPLRIAPALRTAPLTGASDSALGWAQSGTTVAVYDVR